MTDTNALLTAILAELRQLREESRAAAQLGDYGYRWTPDGLPICPKHGEVMTRREKQGDTWYSHQVTDPATGEVTYCRGHEGKNSPGWNIGGSTPPSPGQAANGHTGQPEKAANGKTAKPGPATPPLPRGGAGGVALAEPVRDARLLFYEIGGAAMTGGKISVDKFNGLVNKAARVGFATVLQELQAVAV